MSLPGRARSFLILLALAGAAPGAPGQALKLPAHEKIVLKNGLTVLLLEKRGVPMVNFSLIVKAGTTADPPGQEGLASTTAGLLRKGTAKRSAQKFSSDLDFTGGTFGADAGLDFTSVSAEFLSKDLDRGLDLITDAILAPKFPQEEVDKLLAQQLDGVRAAKDEAQSVLGTYYSGYLYGEHPYARPEGGDEVSLGKIKRSAIVDFYESHYAPGNTILAVAGEFEPRAMKEKVEAAFGPWPARKTAAVDVPPARAVQGKRLLLVDKPDATQTYFAVGNVGISETDPDRVAIQVVNTVFGGRFTSLLNEALRIKSGYSYGADAFFDSRKVAGPFAIMSFTKNETTAPAIDLALEVLRELHQKGITAEQLASAKSYIKGQYPPEIETSGQLARRIAIHEFYGLDDDEVNQMEARMDRVTVETARQVIKKHFPKDDLVFVLIGKASEIGPAVKKFAEKQDSRAIGEPGFWPPKK